MVKHLVLQKKGRHFLLIEYPDRYHIVTVNKRLEVDTEEWILASVCPESFFDDAGLTRETIPKRELRGVAVGGNTAGHVIALFRGKNKYQFVLSDDYEQAYIDEMFEGFERFTAPQNSDAGKRNSDWRKELQDPAMEKLMSVAGSVLNTAGVVFSVVCLFLGDASLYWFLGAVLISVASLTLYLKFPAYYTLMGSKMYKKAGYTASVTHLEFAVLFPLLAMSATRTFEIRDWVAMLIWMALISVASFAALYCMSREIRENNKLMFIVMLLTVVISYGVTFQLNHQLNVNPEPPQSYVLTEKTQYRSGKSRRYHYRFTVILEDGSKLKLDVPSDVYYQVEEGDDIMIYIGKGALGIEYAYFVDICE